MKNKEGALAVKEFFLDEPAISYAEYPSKNKGSYMKLMADGLEGRPQAHVGFADPREVIEAHFHDADQFQVVLEGDVTFVNDHHLKPIAVHYTDTNTPYGPFTMGENVKLAVLRPHKAGITWMTDREGRKNRNPHGRELYGEYGRQLFGQSDDTPWEDLTGALSGIRRKVLFGGDEGPNAQIWQCPANMVVARKPAPIGEYQVLIEGSGLAADKQMIPYSTRYLAGDGPAAPLISTSEGTTWLFLAFGLAS